MYDGHEDLRGSGRRSVIPYVHRERVVLLCVWCCSSWELNLVAHVIRLTFYSPMPDNYTVTQGPTGGLRIDDILYST
jgi:hypothetical protein